MDAVNVDQFPCPGSTIVQLAPLAILSQEAAKKAIDAKAFGNSAALRGRLAGHPAGTDHGSWRQSLRL